MNSNNILTFSELKKFVNLEGVMSGYVHSGSNCCGSIGDLIEWAPNSIFVKTAIDSIIKSRELMVNKPYVTIRIEEDEHTFWNLVDVIKYRKWNFSNKINAFGCMNQQEINQLVKKYNLPENPIDNYDDGCHMTAWGDIIGPIYCSKRADYTLTPEEEYELKKKNQENDYNGVADDSTYFIFPMEFGTSPHLQVN